MTHQYAIDASRLLQRCLSGLRELLEVYPSTVSHEKNCGSVLLPLLSPSSRRSCNFAALQAVKGDLEETEDLLQSYFDVLISKISIRVKHETTEAVQGNRNQQQSLKSGLADRTELLSSLLSKTQNLKHEELHECFDSEEKSNTNVVETGFRPSGFYARRSATDSLLFRLIVALELLLVRIDDARLVITGRRKAMDHQTTSLMTAVMQTTLSAKPPTFAILGSLAYAPVILWTARLLTQRSSAASRRVQEVLNVKKPSHLFLLMMTGKCACFYVFARCLRPITTSWWMTNKLTDSREAILDWNQQWQVIIQPSPDTSERNQSGSMEIHDWDKSETQSRRLVEYALSISPQVKEPSWLSQGQLRFFMLKRFMDVFYASVGTALEATKGRGDDTSADWQVALVSAAASFFFSLTGASRRASYAMSSSDSAKRLIQNAWGMVSWRAVKSLSLQASRLLKGAAVADRIEICGVSCFVLSKEPAPELAAAIQRYHRKRRHRSVKPGHGLSTIDELEAHCPEPVGGYQKPFARSHAHPYRQRDVILHLTGGGFFAHIIASDLPYLLDWSGATGSVVICPEYALLPEHAFPDALNQVEDVYKALLSEEVVDSLGFETNRVILTGESTGGNLAAALCVRLSDGLRPGHSEHSGDANKEENENEPERAQQSPAVRLPTALMLSCPVLNLSLELCHSRVIGTDDPVLPSGLLTAISDSYLPGHLCVDKTNPLASPFFAPDASLCHFPPTLIFASSNMDPLLDDCVVFNQRLRNLGVSSDLKTAQFLPHACLGLGTAGFPEALQVQQQCREWLGFQLAREDP